MAPSVVFSLNYWMSLHSLGNQEKRESSALRLDSVTAPLLVALISISRSKVINNNSVT